MFNKKDMVEFAKWWYGPCHDSLNEVRNVEDGFEFWIRNFYCASDAKEPAASVQQPVTGGEKPAQICPECGEAAVYYTEADGNEFWECCACGKSGKLR